jgi:hypothetical protein
MNGAPDSVRGFGSELHGQEEAGQTLAAYVDELHRLKQARHHCVKEDFKHPLCVDGVGCGKSVLLSHGLSMHKKHCKNRDLLELLKDEHHPLAIHITFSAKTSFNYEHETNIRWAVIRRILASCLDLEWGVARDLPLGELLLVDDCLRAIVDYHKVVHGMKMKQGVFVYLGIDEINQLVRYPSSGPMSDITCLRDLTKATRTLSVPSGFVSTLLAGTHYTDSKQSFRGQGIMPLYLKITRLSDVAIESMLLTDAGLSQKYINNPKFQELLRDIGPAMRAIGIAVNKLEYEYNPQSIDSAKIAVLEYLKSNRMPLSVKDMHALIGLVLTGRPVVPHATLSQDSLITLDSLQNSGTVVLNRTQDIITFSVFMSRLMLESFLYCERDDIVDSANRLLCFIDSPGPASFEKFVAHFYSLKKAVLLSLVRSPVGDIPFAAFFSGALIGDGVLRQELQLKPPSIPPDFPDGVLSWQREHYPDAAEPRSVAGHLKNGGVVLNSKGAAANIVVCENIRASCISNWQKGVTVIATKQAEVGNEELTLAEITTDHDKLVEVFSASKNHSKALVTVIHFSNRELAKELHDVRKWKPGLGRSVVVGRSNIESVVGPMFGRMLTSKAFCGIGGGSKGKPFSTLARAVPAVHRYQTSIAWMSRWLR